VEARRIGLVHDVVPPADLLAGPDRLVAALLTSGPEAVGVAKRLIAEVAGKSPDEAMPVTVRTIADRRASDEAKEGLTAFLEKRPPAWSAKKTGR
jgi:methylglutaconyl-CoA hydratase